ncbi:MAG: sigma-70 family RNA polymerase sigma factor, partial [Planctomycetota bacterium]
MTTPTSAQLDALLAHQGRVRSLVRALLRDEHAAEDVVQEAWIRTLETGPRDAGALRTWFERVARNLARNRMRGRVRRDHHERAAARRDRAPSSAEIAEEVELQRRLLDEVERLPEPHRSVLRDRYLGELTPTAIAKRDGLSLDTVKSRLARARAQLRERLDAQSRHEGKTWSVVFAPLALAPKASLVSSLTGSAGSGLALVTMNKLVLAIAVVVLSVSAWMLRAPTPEPDLASVASNTPEVGRPVDRLAEVDDERAQAADELAAPVPANSGSERRTSSEVPPADWSVTGRVRVFGREERALPSPLEIEVGVVPGFDPDEAPVERATVTTDPDGTFRWTPRAVEGTATIVASAVSDDYLVFSIDPVRVAPGGSPQPLQIAVAPRDGQLIGTVTRADGSPASGATVRWTDFETTANARGQYALSVAPEANYEVIAWAEGHGRAVRSYQEFAPGGTARCDFVLTDEVRVSGRVRDEAGQPVAGARVVALGCRDLETITAADGTYELRTIPRRAGETTRIHAEREGLCDALVDVEMPESGDMEMDLVLSAGARVRGHVQDDAGAPVPGVTVTFGSARYAADRCESVTDGNGAFDLGTVPPGEQTVRVFADGFVPLETTLEVPADQESLENVALVLDRGRAVTGVVRDVNGEPAVGVRVAAKQRGDYLGASAGTDGAGRFTVVGLPAGSVELEVYGGGFVRSWTPVGPAPTGNVEITVVRAGRIRGRVVDAATGSAVTGFTVRLITPVLEEGDRMIGGFTSDWREPGRIFDAPDGRWDTGRERLEPGRVIGVQIAAPGYAPSVVPRVVIGPVDSPDEVPSELVVQLVRPVRLGVDVVQGEDRAPVRGVEVIVSQAAADDPVDSALRATTNANGGADFDGVPPGPVHVRIEGLGPVARTRGPFAVAPGADGQRIEVHLAPAVRLVGTTRDDRTREPIGGIE